LAKKGFSTLLLTNSDFIFAGVWPIFNMAIFYQKNLFKNVLEKAYFD
tara:strand:- start:281 stop:421 length:141 start_codon:yes stop_codon:yes gene_type:complete